MNGKKAKLLRKAALAKGMPYRLLKKAYTVGAITIKGGDKK